jgi:hypothetical protein
MLTFEDCLAMAGLTAEEAAMIAAHEGLPQTLAVELGAFLHRCPGGARCIGAMLQGEIEAARARGDITDAVRLRRLLADLAAVLPAGPASEPAQCLPKLLYPGRHPLHLKACAICERHRQDPAPR